jgi:hypothetical protein
MLLCETPFGLHRIGAKRPYGVAPNKDTAGGKFSFWKYRARNQK